MQRITCGYTKLSFCDCGRLNVLPCPIEVPAMRSFYERLAVKVIGGERETLASRYDIYSIAEMQKDWENLAPGD